MKQFLFVLAASLLLGSCSLKPKPPPHLIDEDTYVDVLIELQLLKAYQKNSTADSSTVDSLMQGIFQKYNVTKKQFEKSHFYYQNQLKTQTARIDKAIDRLREDRTLKKDSAGTDSSSLNQKYLNYK